MVYIIIGKRNGKSFKSTKKFYTRKGAITYGYKLTYTKSGNKKKKNQITDWSVRKQ